MSQDFLTNLELIDFPRSKNAIGHHLFLLLVKFSNVKYIRHLQKNIKIDYES